MDRDAIATAATIIETRIPEDRQVIGLEYGAYINRSGDGWCGYYVRPVGSGRWAVAKRTPEPCGTDAEIVVAIVGELAAPE